MDFFTVKSANNASATLNAPTAATTMKSGTGGMNIVMRLRRSWDVKMPPPIKHVFNKRLVETGVGHLNLIQRKRKIVIEIHGPDIDDDVNDVNDDDVNDEENIDGPATGNNNVNVNIDEDVNPLQQKTKDDRPERFILNEELIKRTSCNNAAAREAIYMVSISGFNQLQSTV